MEIIIRHLPIALACAVALIIGICLVCKLFDWVEGFTSSGSKKSDDNTVTSEETNDVKDGFNDTINVEEVEAENIDGEEPDGNVSNLVDPELLEAVNAAKSSEETPEEVDRILPTDDMISIDPVVISAINPIEIDPVDTPPIEINSNTSIVESFVTMPNRTTERYGFRGGSVGSVMFDKIR